ncbi:hypothetical protein G0U57_005056 [Chelydra serpentina]|uniref:Uncharacterized protein n=1 Tax=Chelydra serpentina TaxID=8475 RepID=A0A8T1RZB0_CHESE|nr:hypothetical protein G0U57_005056 [Chelydra serpentina]
MLGKKAVQMAPEPVGSCCRIPQEESGPPVPADGEAACGQAKRWKCLAFWRKKTPAPRAGPEAPLGQTWRWPRVQLCRRDPGRAGAGHGGSAGFLSGSRGARSPVPGPSRSHPPAWPLKNLQTVQGRRWVTPALAPSAPPTPEGPAAPQRSVRALRLKAPPVQEGDPRARERLGRGRLVTPCAHWFTKVSGLSHVSPIDTSRSGTATLSGRGFGLKLGELQPPGPLMMLGGGLTALGP